jgi:hypothetical protein
VKEGTKNIGKRCERRAEKHYGKEQNRNKGEKL